MSVPPYSQPGHLQPVYYTNREHDARFRNVDLSGGLSIDDVFVDFGSILSSLDDVLVSRGTTSGTVNINLTSTNDVVITDNGGTATTNINLPALGSSVFGKRYRIRVVDKGTATTLVANGIEQILNNVGVYALSVTLSTNSFWEVVGTSNGGSSGGQAWVITDWSEVVPE